MLSNLVGVPDLAVFGRSDSGRPEINLAFEEFPPSATLSKCRLGKQRFGAALKN